MPNDVATSPRWRLGVGQFRRSALDKVAINWEKHEFEPRWIGSETADCVAALQPGHYFDQGDRERDRFLAGVAERGETALLVSMLGYADDTRSRAILHSVGDDSVDFARTTTVVYGSRLPARTNVRLAAGLTPADEDLGKRLRNRPADAPWWSLELDGRTQQPCAGGPSETYPAVGALQLEGSGMVCTAGAQEFVIRPQHPGMPDGSCGEPGRESADSRGAPRSSLAGRSSASLREWLPGVFAARLLPGMRMPDGRMVGETDRVVHLLPIPSGRVIPDQLRAFCGLVIRSGQAELAMVGAGTLCVRCVFAAPDPEPA